MKRLAVFLFIGLLVLSMALPADAGGMPTRRCKTCHQVFYNDWWKFCPRCGTEGSEPIENPTTEGIPVVEGFTIINNTYRNLPHRFQVERPANLWEFRHGQALRNERDDLNLRIELPKTTVSVDVMAAFSQEEDLQKYLTERLKPGKNYHVIRQVGGQLGQAPMARREYRITQDDARQNIRLVVMAIRKDKLNYLVQATSLESDYKIWSDDIRKIFDSFKLLEQADMK